MIKNQRERLFGAIVAVVSEKGYEATTVADVIELSGVSRSAFYGHFSNKAECLAAAAAELIPPTMKALAAAEEEGAPESGRAIFERFLELIVLQPAAARACLVELPAAGEVGEAVDNRAFEAVATLAERIGGPESGAVPLDPALMRVLLGGIRQLIHMHLWRGEQDRLPGLAPDLWRWLVSVATPPRPLVAPRRQRAGSITRFEGYTPGERIARAVASVLAEKGYLQMSTDDIAARAAISLSTFYAHFADKRDAVLGTLEMSGAQIMALAVPAARRAGEWQEGVRALYEAICAYFAAEPEMARPRIGRGLRRRAEGAGASRPGDRLADRDDGAGLCGESRSACRSAAEAAAATVYALMGEQVRRRGAPSLPSVVPLATYITLVGFVGPERACEVANGDRASRR